MKHTRALMMVIALVLAACTQSCPRSPRDTKLPPGNWTRIEPGGDTGCAIDAPFAFWVRPGQVENKLLIYFQGGGMCWKAENCLRDEGYDHFVGCENYPGDLRGIFDLDHEGNPFVSYDVVFIPYCTGDLHWGDRVVTYQKDNGCEFPIYHLGYVNAQSALEWVYENCPAPDSIFVTGCSAGSAGSIFHAAHISKHYPDSLVTQLGDSAAEFPLFNLDAAYGARQNFMPDCSGLEDLPDSFTLSRASQRWQGVRMSEIERQQLRLLRRELGLLPDGTQDAIGLKSRQLAA